MRPLPNTPAGIRERTRSLRSTDRTVLLGTVACCCLAVLAVVATAFTPSLATIVGSSICVLSAVALIPFCRSVRVNLRTVLDELAAALAETEGQR